MEEEQTALRTDIFLDFDRAIASMASFEERVNALTERFNILARNAGAVDYNLASRIQQEIGRLRSGLNVDLKLDGDFLQKKISTAIMNRVKANGVQVNAAPFTGPFKVNIGREVWRDLRADVQKKLAKSLKNPKVTGKLEPMKFNLLTMRDFQSKLQSSLSEELGKGLEPRFEWAGTNGEQDKISIALTPETLQPLVDQIRNRVIMGLRKGVVLEGELPKFPIDATAFNTIVEKFAGNLREVQDELVKFSTMPVEETTQNFRRLNTTMKGKLIAINDELQEAIAQISDTSLAVQVEAVSQKLARFSVDINAQLDALARALTLGTVIPEREAVQASVQKVVQQMQKLVNNIATKTVTEIRNLSGAFTPDTQAMQRVVERISNRVTDVALGAMRSVLDQLSPVTMTNVSTLYNEWQGQLRMAVQANTAVVLEEIARDTVLAQEAVMRSLQDSVRELVQAYRGGPLRVEFSVAEVRQNLERVVGDLVRDMVAGMNLVPSQVDTLQVDGIQSSLLKAYTKIQEVIEKKVRLITQELEKGASLVGDAYVDKQLGQRIGDKTKTVLKTIVSTIRQSVDSLVREAKAVDVSDVLTEAQGTLQRKVRMATQSIVSKVTRTVQEAAVAFVVSEEVKEAIRARLQSALNRVMKTNIKFSFSGEYRIALDLALQEAIQRVSTEVIRRFRDWNPPLGDDALNLTDGTARAINTSMRNMINKIVKVSAQQARQLVAEQSQIFLTSEQSQMDVIPYLNMIGNTLQGVVRDYVMSILTAFRSADPVFRVHTNQLHSGVRRELARQQEMTVQEFMRQNPFLEGQEAFFQVMRENVSYIFSKFHQTLQRDAVRMMRDYEDAMARVEVKPDHTIVEYLTTQIREIQQDVVVKVRQVMEAQFRLIRDELRRFTAQPLSLGWMPGPVAPASSAVAAPAPAVAAPRTVPPYYPAMGGATRNANSFNAADRGYFPVDTSGSVSSSPVMPVVDPGGSTRNFTSSVVNTMRYITAGAAIGVPFMLFHSAVRSVEEFDYQLEKAFQNFMMKDPTMQGAAEERVRLRMENAERLGDYGVTQQQYTNEETRQQIIEEEAKNLQYMAREGVVKQLQDLAILNAVGQEEVAKAFQISSRGIDDPYEALDFTRGVTQVYAIEDVDLEQAAKGFEAVKQQWQISGEAIPQVSNMMIKAANITNATVEDLLETQQRAGSLFMQGLPDMTKEEALATSIGLSSIFTQATARSGRESGTFWKSVLTTPFRPETLNYLEDMSQTAGMGDLYPYIEAPDGTKQQKPITQILFDVIDASQRLDDEDRKRLLTELTTQWQIGGLTSVTEFIEGMDEDLERAGKVIEQVTGGGTGSGFAGFVSAIQEASPEDIERMRAGMMGTFRFMGGRVGAEWPIAMQGVFDELKDEFATTLSYLSVFLRTVRENADQVATLLEVLTKIGGTLGLRFVSNRAIRGVNNRRQNQVAQSVDRSRYFLNEEGRLLNLRRIAMENQQMYYTGRLGGIQEKRFTAETRAMRLQNVMGGLESKRDEVGKIILPLQQAGVDINSDPRLARYQNRYDTLTNRINRITPTYRNQEKEVRSYMAMEQRMGSFLSSLDRQMVDWRKQAEDLNRRMRFSDKAATDLGVDPKRLKNQLTPLSVPAQMAGVAALPQMDKMTAATVKQQGATRQLDQYQRKLNQTYVQTAETLTAGSRSMDRYADEITQMRREMDLADDDLRRLRLELQQLDRQLAVGAITPDEAIRRAQRLERGEMTSQLPGGGIGPNASANQFGLGALSMIAMGSLFGGKMTLPPRKVSERLQDATSMRNPLYLMERNRPVRDVYGNLQRGPDGRVLTQRLVEERGMPMLDLQGNPLRDPKGNLIYEGDVIREQQRRTKQGPNLWQKGVGAAAGAASRTLNSPFMRGMRSFGLYGLAFSALGGGMDALATLGMTDAERSLESSNKLNDLSRAVLGGAEGGVMDKVAAGTKLLFSAPSDLVSSLFGGTAPGFVDYGRLIGALITGNTETLQEMVQQTEDTMAESRVNIQKELEDKQPSLRADDLLQMTDEELQDILKLTDVEEILGKLGEDLQREFTSLNIDFLKDKLRLVRLGVEEDSLEMFQLQRQFTQNQIKMLREQLRAQEKLYEQVVAEEGETSQRALQVKDSVMETQSQLLESQTQDALAEREKQRVDYEGNKRLEELEFQLQRLSSLGEIERADVILGGAEEDSAAVKAAERESALAQYKVLEQIKSRLKEFYDNTKSDTELNREIELRMLDTELQQKETLVKLQEELSGSRSTFNLPADVRPISYLEAMTAENSVGAMTVRAGDTIVQVFVDNMSGSASDVNRVARAVSDAARDAQTNTSRLLSRQVKTGMGRNYKSF